MIKKHNIILIFLFFVLVFNTTAQEKVIDKSQKKRPDWVNATISNYIIVTGRGKTIDEAKGKVVDLIRKEIMNSVAVYVSSSSEMTTENINKNNIINTIEKFKNTSTLQTGDIPSLKGISINKVSSFYWEKIMDKKTKKVTTAYHVMYPFSKIELNKLISEFNKRDQEMTDRLNGIINNIDKIQSIDEIYMKTKELQQLLGYFVDKQRTEKTNMGIVRLKEMLNSVEITPLKNSPGLLKYAFKIGDKFYSSSKKPSYKNSECVNIISKISEGYEQIIKYNYEDCLEDEKNFISIRYKFGNSKVEKKFYFNISQNIVDVFLKGDILLSKTEESNDTIKSFKCDITLSSKYDTPFTVEKIVLKWKNVSPVTISNINSDFEGKGTHSLIIKTNSELLKDKTSSANVSFVDGTIFIRSKVTNELKRTPFFNQNIETDW